MKHALFTFLILGTLLSACIDPIKPIHLNLPKKKGPNAQVIKNTEQLHTILSEPDTLNIDAIQKCIDTGVDPNYSIPFEQTISSTPFRPGSFFSFLNSSSTRTWNLNALQATFFSQKPGYENAVFLLLNQGADLNNQSSDNMVCLDWVNLLELHDTWQDTLISLGADPALVNLDMAGTNLDLIEFYVNQGADSRTINLNHFFESKYNRECRMSGKNVWINDFSQVLKYDVNAQALNPKELISTYWPSDFTFLDMLVNSGLDFNKPVDHIFRKRKTTPKEIYWLDLALKYRNEKMVKYLLQNGATETNTEFNSAQLDAFTDDPVLMQLMKDKLIK